VFFSFTSLYKRVCDYDGQTVCFADWCDELIPESRKNSNCCIISPVQCAFVGGYFVDFAITNHLNSFCNLYPSFRAVEADAILV